MLEPHSPNLGVLIVVVLPFPLQTDIAQFNLLTVCAHNLDCDLVYLLCCVLLVVREPHYCLPGRRGGWPWKNYSCPYRFIYPRLGLSQCGPSTGLFTRPFIALQTLCLHLTPFVLSQSHTDPCPTLQASFPRPHHPTGLSSPDDSPNPFPGGGFPVPRQLDGT